MATTSQTVPDQVGSTSAQPNGSSPPAVHDLFANLPQLPSVPGAQPSYIAFDAFRTAVADQIAKILDLKIEDVYKGVESGKRDADMTVAVPRFRLKGDPKVLSKRLAEEIKPNEYIERAEAVEAFLNIYANTETLTRLVLNQVNALTHLTTTEPLNPSTSSSAESSSDSKSKHEPQGIYGFNTLGAGKKVIVEFSSPNIAKKFHAGHLRSTIIGACIANLHKANGWEVIRMNYLGDWGKQFGLLAIGLERYGAESTTGKDPIQHLFEVYVKISADQRKGEETGDTSVDDAARAAFKKMEDGDPEALATWKKIKDLSIAKYKETYDRLNIHFDVYSGESHVSPESQDRAVKQLIEQKIVTEDKGTLLIDLEKYKLGKTPIRKSDGTTLYITRDIGAAIERYEEYKFTKMIYVVASQQDLHLKQFFKVLDLMGFPWSKTLEHISFGMIRGMSTRRGTVEFLENILDEARDVMHEQMRSNEEKYKQVEDPEFTSDVIGISGVKVQDLSGKRINDYTFDWSRMKAFEGDTGAYMQNAHVRLCSIERKAAPEVVLPPPSARPKEINTTLLTEPKARAIVVLLALYPDSVKNALDKSEPSTIVTYIFRLAHAISSAYEVLIVKGQEKDVALARLWLYVTARDVLASAMRLITLSPLERM